MLKNIPWMGLNGLESPWMTLNARECSRLPMNVRKCRLFANTFNKTSRIGRLFKCVVRPLTFPNFLARSTKVCCTFWGGGGVCV
jgi:hypothetical protein